ncbi:MAG: MarR family winged helix-turn-helix transcriptional regulator [Pyramidobacter sp.]
MIPLQQISKALKNLDEKIDALYRYQSVMNCYSLMVRDYGTGITLSEVEAHTLNSIQQEEGLTSKRLAEISDRTKSSISQITSKLEKNGLIRREVNPENKREYRLYLTELGEKTCEAHRNYDREGMLSQVNYLLGHCTPEEIDSFFKVLQYRIGWFRRVNKTLHSRKNRQGDSMETARFTGC